MPLSLQIHFKKDPIVLSMNGTGAKLCRYLIDKIMMMCSMNLEVKIAGVIELIIELMPAMSWSLVTLSVKNYQSCLPESTKVIDQEETLRVILVIINISQKITTLNIIKMFFQSKRNLSKDPKWHSGRPIIPKEPESQHITTTLLIPE